MSNTPLTLHLAPWIEQLRKLIAHHAGLNRALAPVVVILWGRLGRMLTRLASLEARWSTATLRPARRRSPRPARPARATPPPRLPGAHAWLHRLIPHVGSVNTAIAALLADPETRALVEAAPQAGRLLRPLARMLGIHPPAWLRLPRRPRKPRPPKPKTPKLRLTPLRLTRAQIDRMSAAELTHLYGRLPPHFPLPIPNLNHIRRKIAAG